MGTSALSSVYSLIVTGAFSVGRCVIGMTGGIYCAGRRLVVGAGSGAGAPGSGAGAAVADPLSELAGGGDGTCELPQHRSSHVPSV
jgi:hypothetical protein